MTPAGEQTTDDELCVQVSDGHKWTFIVAALAKRVLRISGIKPADRLALLEKLNAMTDDWFTADMLAGIEPMCDTGYAIFKEAKSLDAAQDNKHCEASFEVLARLKVFRHFCALNPSIIAAIKYRAADRQDRHAAPPPVETPPPRPPAATGAARFAHTQRRMNGAPAQHRSHLPPDQINRMGGGLPDWTYDSDT
jgi:hypothetical protein